MGTWGWKVGTVGGGSSFLAFSPWILQRLLGGKIKVPLIVKATQTISLTSSAGAALQRRELFPLITPLISSLPALLNSFPLCPPPFPSAHLALAHSRCEARHKHGGRCVARGRKKRQKGEAVSVWRCESPGAFDPIKRKKEKNSNLDG